MFDELISKINLIVDDSVINSQMLVTLKDVDDFIIDSPKHVCQLVQKKMLQKHGDDIDVITTFNITHKKYFNGEELEGYPELMLVVVVQDKIDIKTTVVETVGENT